MSTLKIFIKNTFIYGIAAILPKAINIVLVRLHTSSMDEISYSENTSFYIWIAYLNVLLSFGMETAFFRFFNKEESKDKVVYTSFLSILFLSVLCFIVLYFNAANITDFLGLSKVWYVELLVIIAILDALIVIPFAYLRAMNKAGKYTFYRLLNIGIYTIINVLFLFWIPRLLQSGYAIPAILKYIYVPNIKQGYIFIANLIGNTATFICVLPILFKFKCRFDYKLFVKMFLYSWPIVVSGLAYTINEGLDRIIIEKTFGKAQMGVYSAAYKIGVVMSLYITAFKLGAEPFFFSYASKKNAPQTYAKITYWFSIIGSLVLLTVVAFLPVISKLLLGQQVYFKALDIVPIILLANLFLGIYHNLSIWYKLTDKTHYGMVISLIGSFITIISLFILLPLVGYIGAAWATLCTYFGMCVTSYFIGQKIYPVPYKYKRILLYLIFSTVYSFLMFYVFENRLDFSILCVIVFICFILRLEWKEIKELRIIKKR